MSGRWIALGLWIGLGIFGSEASARNGQQGNVTAQVEAAREAFLWQGGADEPAADLREELLTELARLSLALAAERDFDGVSAQLAKVWLRAARVEPYDGRFEVLARIAQARAELFLERGELEAARAALERLLPDREAARTAGAEEHLVAASAELLEQERAALRDARLEQLRARIASGKTPATAWLETESDAKTAAEIAGDPLLLRVHRALEEGDQQFLQTLGFSAVPALARLTELSIERVIPDPTHDPLIALVSMAELRAADLVLAKLDQGGSFWRKRVLRAMQDAHVLSNQGTWEVSSSDGRTVCREPQWIAALERLAAEPELLRECLPLMRELEARNVLTPPLLQALITALRSEDADLSLAALQSIEDFKEGAALRPVYEALLEDPREHLRRFAAEVLASYSDPGPLRSAVGHPDPVVRWQLFQWIERHRNALSAEDWNALERLASDEVVNTRLRAIQLLSEMGREPLSDNVYRRMATDPSPEVRKYVALSLTHPNPALLQELLLALASDPDADVLEYLDGRLAMNDNRTPPAVRLAVARRRWEVAHAAPMTLEAAARFARTAESLVWMADGGVEVAHWALESDDRQLLSSVLSIPQRGAAGVDALRALDQPELSKLFTMAAEIHMEGGDFGRRAFEFLWACAADFAASPTPPMEAMHRIIEATDAPFHARLAALAVLASRPDASFERELLAALADPRWSGPPPDGWDKRALTTIARALPDAARNAILLRVIGDANVDDAAAAQLVAGGLAPPTSDDAALVRALLARWFDPAQMHPAVNEAFRNPGAFPEAFDAEVLTRAAHSNYYADRAVVAMGLLLDPHFLSVLGECLDASWLSDLDYRSRVQTEAVQALTRYLSDDAAQVLLDGVAKAPNAQLRQECFDGVQQISRYQEEKGKLIARKLAGKQRDDAILRIGALLADPDPELRAEAARSAATLGAVELLPDLVQLLRADDERVRAAARAALDRLNAPVDDGH